VLRRARRYLILHALTASFTFETAVGLGSGILRLVSTKDSGDLKAAWKAHSIFTNLESLKGFPEKINGLRDHNPLHGGWVEKRTKEVELADDTPQPAVIVVGGGQSGLQIAARLKVHDIPTLVVEKQDRVGDQWRNRYEALCLHDPVCEWSSRI
jgi:lysine/ornithine N-monooxygenase